ncbi:hypothetical protein GCM10017056_08180 [Seohaeicola zhoushanensis]|uniref:Uncharacterized protein n=1 Tax=Seohaeicola zhoushanensis TaxID=1569283 RepID=A0A8J3M5X4_9RHOB|nr:hypothetical protein GCM10017056_08180 [Seohaeicola zhoushanensis]
MGVGQEIDVIRIMDCLDWRQPVVARRANAEIFGDQHIAQQFCSAGLFLMWHCGAATEINIRRMTQLSSIEKGFHVQTIPDCS